MKCPFCGNSLDEFDYCDECMKVVDGVEEYDDNSSQNQFNAFDDTDYDSRINNGEAICLNCTYWSVSPHGSAYGMICRRGYLTQSPGDSCGDFVPESYHASYGDSGQYQFNETGQAISNKLYHWKNSR